MPTHHHIGGMDMKRTIAIVFATLFFTLAMYSQGTDESIELETVRILRDSRGLDISLPETVERVVSLSPNITETIYALERGSTLVGRTDYCNYPEQTSQVPSVGDLLSPSVEQIIALDPQVVLISTLGQLQIIDALESAGITLFYINEPGTMEGTYQMITMVADILSAARESETLIAGMKGLIQEVQSKVRQEKAVSTYYVAGFGQWGDFSATGDTFLHEIITLAGGDNVASDGSNWTYSLERLIMHDPEVIILPATWGSTFEQTLEAFTSFEAYRGLTAVKQGRIYDVQADILNRQGPRSALGVKLLAEILHPGQFK